MTENVGVREVCIVKDLETTINFTASYFTTEGTAIGNRYLHNIAVCSRHCVETVACVLSMLMDRGGCNRS